MTKHEDTTNLAGGSPLERGVVRLPESDLMVDCAQGMVRGWTATSLADVLKLAAFGAWAAREFRATLADVDGGSAQDAMERLGVLVRTTVTEPCGVGCVCVEYGAFPHECYTVPPGLAALIRA
jgi:hypothetical protein